MTVGLAGFRSQADDAAVNKARELGCDEGRRRLPVGASSVKRGPNPSRNRRGRDVALSPPVAT